MKVTVENLNESLTVLKSRMASNVVSFTFAKKDGTERIARGTLNFDIMGDENIPKGTATNRCTYTTSYFDVDKNQWRCFINANLLSIEI